MLWFSMELKIILRLGQLCGTRRKADNSGIKKEKLFWKCVAVFVKFMKLDLELGSWLTQDEPDTAL